MAQVILEALWTSPLHHLSCFKSALNFRVQMHSETWPEGSVWSLWVSSHLRFTSHKKNPTPKHTHPKKTPRKPQNHQPNKPQPLPKSQKTPQILFTFLKSLLGMYSQQCCKQNRSLPGSQIRKMFYRVPGMKPYHPLDICNIQFSSLSYVLQISCAHFFQNAVQTGSHLFTRSPAEGIKKLFSFTYSFSWEKPPSNWLGWSWGTSALI